MIAADGSSPAKAAAGFDVLKMHGLPGNFTYDGCKTGMGFDGWAGCLQHSQVLKEDSYQTIGTVKIGCARLQSNWKSNTEHSVPSNLYGGFHVAAISGKSH